MKRSHWMHLSILTILIAGFSLNATGQAANDAPLLPVNVLTQSPAETQTELQIICLFQSSPENTLHGSLVETNDKLHGLLDQIRKPGLFSGDLGETILLTSQQGTLNATKLLIIGLGDSETFTPERMTLIGRIALREANRLGIAHPFFAPTILDGGVGRFSTGEVAEKVVRGVREAVATESVLRNQNAAPALRVLDFTYLAGAKNAANTQIGIDRALDRLHSPAR